MHFKIKADGKTISELEKNEKIDKNLLRYFRCFIILINLLNRFPNKLQNIIFYKITTNRIWLRDSGPIYIIKSTVVPGTTNSLIEKYKNLDIIFSPEFLTERTAKLDIITQTRIILGGNSELTSKVRLLFEARFMNKNIISCHWPSGRLYFKDIIHLDNSIINWHMHIKFFFLHIELIKIIYLYNPIEI